MGSGPGSSMSSATNGVEQKSDRRGCVEPSFRNLVDDPANREFSSCAILAPRTPTRRRDGHIARQPNKFCLPVATSPARQVAKTKEEEEEVLAQVVLPSPFAPPPARAWSPRRARCRSGLSRELRVGPMNNHE